MRNLMPFSEMEDLFDRYIRGKQRYISKNADENGELTIPDWAPAVDIREKKDAYVIKAELPGVASQDVSATLEKGVLTIRGEKHFEKQVGEDRTHRIECSYGQFVRSFSLPEAVEEEQVAASYKDGVLTLNIPKSKKAQPKAIEIKTS